MLYLIVSLLLTLTTLADLDSVTEEWIAPGVDISRETLIEFADHGEMFQSESEPYVGCHVAFVEVNGQEKWRAVVVYADRVVLFQEDQEPVITLFDFPVDNLSFSESGNYVVLHDGGEVDTDRNGLQINTETGENIFFDAQPEGMLGKTIIVVWDDGRMQFAREICEYSYRYFWLDSNTNLITAFDVNSTTLKATSTNYLLVWFNSLLHCYNSEVEEIWTCDLPSSRAIAGPVISEINESFVIAFDEEIQVRSLASSEVLYSHSLPCGSLPVQLLINKANTAFSCYFVHEMNIVNNTYNCYVGNFHNAIGLTTSLFKTSPIHRMLGISGKTILISRGESQSAGIERAYMILNSDYDVRYIVPKGQIPIARGITDRGNRAVISGNGKYLLMRYNTLLTLTHL